MKNFQQLFSFIIETEKLKSILRKTKVIGLDRYENSAEHSWTVSLIALLIENFTDANINKERIIKMLLVHDIVEIDAGDKFVYDNNHTDTENELKAAIRIFGLLPVEICEELKNLWLEYETRETIDSKYAYLIDRMIPMIQNLNNNGQSWKENNITLQQVIDKNSFIKELIPELWDYLYPQLIEAKEKGWLS